jgi:pentose-5-phosphate-3-epimerase
MTPPPNRQCRIHPSILSADFANLQSELKRISTADAVHVDVMDNHFVPNLTLGLPVVTRIQEVSPVPLDVPELDMLLIMTVEPGFGGQEFLDVMLPKIRRARAAIDGSGADVAIQVDGGVSADTITRAAEAGADVFVAGSAVYNASDPEAVIASLRTAGQQAIG